jgi:hypothetical protein
MTTPATSNTPTTTPTPVPGDVLHNENHSRLTTQDIAKAVARYHREHPNQAPRVKPQKTTPRR